MKKTVSFLSACMFLVATAHAADKIVVASAAGTQQAKVAVVKKAAAKKAEKVASSEYALESFGCCGLPQ
jgi:hypothetical protein